MEAGAITVRTVAALLLASWPRRLILGGLLLVPVIIAALGGFGKAEPRSFDVAPGADVDLGPLIMRPIAFFVSDETERSGLEYTDGAEAWLGVIVEVENLIDTPVTLTSAGPASDALMPQLPEGVLVSTSNLPTSAVRVEDGTIGDRALPGVRTEVAMLWAISDAEAVPDVLPATMTESLWTFGPLSNENVWLSLGDEWDVELPRTELPPSMLEPEEEV